MVLPPVHSEMRRVSQGEGRICASLVDPPATMECDLFLSDKKTWRYLAASLLVELTFQDMMGDMIGEIGWLDLIILESDVGCLATDNLNAG
jgi:hypothetical protein